jgi:hypothetical protein
MSYEDPVIGDRLLPFLYEGEVIDRDDPEGLGRVTVKIEGIMEESPWAWPEGAGAEKWGANRVPPKGALVNVQFLRGDPRRPVYRPGRIVRPPDAPHQFPEFESPDVQVFGAGPFRLILDLRAGQERATVAAVREFNGVEERTVEFVIDLANGVNAAKLYATTAFLIETLGIVDIDGRQTQIQGRVVTPNGKALNG